MKLKLRRNLKMIILVSKLNRGHLNFKRILVRKSYLNIKFTRWYNPFSSTAHKELFYELSKDFNINKFKLKNIVKKWKKH